MDAAQHIWICEIHDARFVQKEDWPTTLQLKTGENLTTVRLFGTVVSTDELIVDDGTGSILVRTFGNPCSCTIGDLVLIIGKPRQYNGEPYLLGEIVKKTHPAWAEIAKKTRPIPKDPLEIIKKLDNGDGADYEACALELGKTGEEIITRLLAMGELFETRPGKLKVLD